MAGEQCNFWKTCNRGSNRQKGALEAREDENYGHFNTLLQKEDYLSLMQRIKQGKKLICLLEPQVIYCTIIFSKKVRNIYHSKQPRMSI